MTFNDIIKIIKNFFSELKQKRQITAFDIAVFLRQFATLISAGIPIIQSCDILEKNQEKLSLRILIYSIKRDMLAGKSFFSTLKKYPVYFDILTCHLIQIGEYTGKLDTMLMTVANDWENNLILQKQFKQALFYPCIISVTALIVTIGMLLFVIPRFAELFQDVQEKLPLFTIWIFYLSKNLQQYIWFLLVGVLFFSILFFQKKFYKRNIKTIVLFISKFPFIKVYLHKISLARFARNLAITFAAGIPIVEALKLIAQGSGNLEFANVITKLCHKVSSGMQLHHAMENFSCFPVLLIQMIKIGEESGILDNMLNKVADFLESEIEQLVDRLKQLLEPLIMLVLGVLIGGLVIAMYLPIFKLGTTI